MSRQPFILFVSTDKGCIVPLSHKLNADGYFRTVDFRYKGRGHAPKIMYHRYIWETAKGAIPAGYEIDHLCRNRACCNIEHLQCIPIGEHKKKHNSTRYAERQNKAYKYWLEHSNISGTKLGALFDVSFGTACKWVRKWKVQRLSETE